MKKKSTATIKENEETVTNATIIPSRVTSRTRANLKDAKDFQEQIEHGRSNRQRIKKIHQSKMNEILNQGGISDINKSASESTLDSYINLRATKQEYDNFKSKLNEILEMDTQIPNHEKVSLFPVAEKKIFPIRPKNAKGWQVGLREYGIEFNSKKELLQQYETESNLSLAATTTTNNEQNELPLSSQFDDTIFDHLEKNERATKKIEFLKLRQGSLYAMRVGEQKKTQYGIEKLPSLTIENVDKYFGNHAKKIYYETYKQLKGQGEISYGGYDTLHDLIQQDNETNPFVSAIEELRHQGVLPNHSLINKHQSVTIMNMTSDGKHFNQAVTGEDGRVFDIDDVRSPKSLNNHSHYEKIRTEDHLHPDEDSSFISHGDGSHTIGTTEMDGIHPTHRDHSKLNTDSSSPMSIKRNGSHPTQKLSRFSTDDDSNDMSYRYYPSTYQSKSPSPSPIDPKNVKKPSKILSYSIDKLSLHEKLKSKLEEDSDDENVEIGNHYNQASPRALFLNGCLKSNVPPITLAILRKKITTIIDLSHFGLGNDMAMVLAECLHLMPYLQILNLADNNLGDDALAAILISIAKHPNIELLDISQNIIGTKAAIALGDLISSPDYKLKCLRMSDANIDDGECAKFVELLMHNRHLKELDLSKNLLGKDENLNVVQPDFVTGGEALSELLKNEDCPITILNLHWNMIRLEGAEVLCGSLRHNQTLTHLDLSYNAIGRVAADILGATLTDNRTLREINIANNGIDAYGCFTICIGARENFNLEKLVIDGNPIGEQGGRILVKLAASDGDRLSIHANSCDLTIKTPEAKLDMNEPFGSFDFDLSKPYERAAVLEILNLISIDPTIQVTFFDFSSPDMDVTSSGEPMRLTRCEVPHSELNYHEIQERKDLKSLNSLIYTPIQSVLEIVLKYDTSNCLRFESSCISAIMMDLKIVIPSEQIEEMKLALDPLQTGHIDLQEFIQFIIERAKTALHRIHDLTHKTFTALSTSPKMRFIPPNRGRFRIKLFEGIMKLDHSFCHPISRSKCKNVIALANATTHPAHMLSYGIDSFRLYLEEARLLFDQLIAKSDDVVTALAKLVTKMHDPRDANRLIRCYFGRDIQRNKRLKQKLGQAYNPLVGIYSGFYSLDLALPQDRICLIRLIEQGIRNEFALRRQGKWDTSQHGRWDCFRNEYHQNPSSPDIYISSKYFMPIPKSGKIQFDFINTMRPDPELNKPAHMDIIIDILLLSRLLHEDQIHWAISKLNRHLTACRKSFMTNGAPCWRRELATAINTGDILFNMYSNIDERKKSYMKFLKKDAAVPRSAGLQRVGLKPIQRPLSSNGEPEGATSNATNSETINLKKELGSNTLAELKAVAASASPKLKKGIPSAASSKTPKKAAIINNFDQLSGISFDQNDVIIQEDITKFRTMANLVLQMHNKTGWKKRLYEVMYENNFADEMKSLILLEYFEAELITSCWLFCAHVAIILELFKCGTSHRSSFGTYRIELLIIMFDRIVDIQNFEIIMMILSAEEQAAVYARIGMLNVFNPNKPEGGYLFDLCKRDERQVAKMLIHLSVTEPGENWQNKTFMFDRGFVPMPGWDLTVTWLNEEGLPRKGILIFEFFAGDGMNTLGCNVNRSLRNKLTSLVLVESVNTMKSLNEEYLINHERTNIMDQNKLVSNPLPTVQPLEKLRTQRELLKKFNYDKNQNKHDVLYTVEDVNNALSNETDIQWNYTHMVHKYEPW